MKTILTLIAAAALASCAGQSSNATGVKPYLRDTCAVTDNKLGTMGPVVSKVYGDKQVKFCCQPCVAKFEKDPQRYLAAL
jgi:hypothetical protein